MLQIRPFQLLVVTGIFKQVLENMPTEFHNICGRKDVAISILLKIVQNWTAGHFCRSQPTS